MRLIPTILAAISSMLLIFVLFFWARSHMRYEGILHYSEGAPARVTASGNGKTVDEELTGKSSGWVSFPGQLTYISITNPVRSADWESWSDPIDTSISVWPSLLAADAITHHGLSLGPTQTQGELRDPMMGIAWRLPYWYFTIPYWMLAIVLAILPYHWTMDYRRAVRREKLGLCVRCGESVKGLTGKCPKCGTAIP
jgi:hypothetical protein